jgi:hypothetical protein
MFPKTFKLGGHTYKVLHPYVFEEVDGLTGQNSCERRLIKVRNTTEGGATQAETHQFRVFMHEVVHAIDQIFCMDSIGSECNKEALLDGISEGLTQFLLENDLWKEPKEENGEA